MEKTSIPDDYPTKANGGYSLTIGSYTLEQIGEYSPSWAKVYDTQNSFNDHTGQEVKVFKGVKFSLKLTTGQLTVTAYNSLIAELQNEYIAISCPEFSGDCTCDDVSCDLKQANSTGTRYKVSFTLTAKETTIPPGGL